MLSWGSTFTRRGLVGELMGNAYALSCPQNIETKLTTSLNEIAIRLTTSLFLIEIRIEHGS
jgi:hypothetical protein